MKTWKQKQLEAQKIWDGMKALNPSGCEKVERSVKKRMRVVRVIYKSKLS